MANTTPTPVQAPNSLVSNSYMRITDVLGEGPIKGFVVQGGPYGNDPLCSTYYNDTNVRNQDGSYNFNVSGQGYTVYYTFGTTGQTAMSGFENIENIIPLGSYTQVTNPPPGLGNVNNVTATFNTSMYPDANSIKVTVQVPALYTEDQNGNVNSFVLTYDIDISLNNGPFVNFDRVTINGKCTAPYLYTTLYTLPITSPASSFYQWTVRVKKPTLIPPPNPPPNFYNNQDIDSTLTSNSLFVNSIGVIGANSYTYPNTALVGTFIAADQFGSVPTRSYLIDGLLMNVPNGYTPPQYVPGLQVIRSCEVDIGDRNIGMTIQDPSQLNGIMTGMSVTGASLAPNSIINYVNNVGPVGSFGFGVNIDPIGNSSGPLTFINPNYPNTFSVTPAVYPQVWTGDFQTGVWTNNPAWVFYDLLTNPRYGLGDYIQPQLVDKWGLYSIAQYCDDMVDNGQNNGGQEPRFSCNINLRQPDDAYNVLLDFVSVFRGMMYYMNGSITATQTSDKTAVFDYTNANVIGGRFSYADSAKNTRSTVAQVRWNDPNNLYRQNTAYVEDTQGILRYGYVLREAAAFGCTSQGQATRLGQWMLLAEKVLTETVSFQVGLDGLYIQPGDVFNVYDNFRNNLDQGGRILAFDHDRQSITLDRPVVIQPNYHYTLSAVTPKFTLDGTGQITGSNQIPLIHNSQIETRNVTTSTTSGTTVLSLDVGFGTGLFQGSPWILSVVSGGTIFNNSALYQCLSTVETQPGIIEIAALQYNTGINQLVYQTGNIVTAPTNSGNFTPISAPTQFGGTYVTGLLAGNQFYSYLALTWVPPQDTNLWGYVLSGDNGVGNPFIKLTNTNSTGYNYMAAITGQVDFVLQSRSKGGMLSSGVPYSFTFPQVPGVDPAQIRFWELPDGFGDLQQIAVFYNRPDPSVTSTRIFYSTGVSFPFSEVLDQGFYPAEGTAYSGLAIDGTTAAFRSTSFDMATIVGQSAIDQAANSLLYLIDNELMSVGPVTGQGNSQYQFGVNRGVFGTFPAAHSANTTGWLFYTTQIESFHRDDMAEILDSTGLYNTGYATRYFQIQNGTIALEGAVVPPAPGLAYMIPNPAPDAPTNVTASGGTGKIVRLSWTAPNDTNILQYQIYRATGPAYADQALIGEDVNTHYDDIAVVLNTPYEYWVATEAVDEEVSPLSAPVFFTPSLILPSGVNPYPPIDPLQASIVGANNYFAQDGTLLASVTLSVPGTPTGAAMQNVVVNRYTGSSSLQGATIMSQITGTTAQRVTIFDLAPNTTYNIGTQSLSNFGLFSADVVAANLSPYTMPFSSPTPGQPGSAPATPLGLMASGGLGGVANFIQLTWTANTEPNLEEYGVYRSHQSSPTPSSPFAFVGANSFMDGNVTGGHTYWYWVSAYNRSEQQSALTSSVSATTQQAPTAPIAITLAASGYSNASDGTVFIDFTFNVPGLVTNAVGQQLMYGTGTDSSKWAIGNDLTNTSPGFAVINDLSPGRTYYFGLSEYSLNGASSAITPSNPASFLVPSKTVFVRANPPSNVQMGGAVFGVPPIAVTTYLGSLVQPAATGSFTASPDPDIAFYEYYNNSISITPSDTAPVNYAQTIPASVTSFAFYASAVTANYLWIRAINTSAGTSTWVRSVTFSNGTDSYAGNLGAQNFDGTQLTKLQVGASATQTITEAHFQLTNFQMTGAPSMVSNVTMAIDISAYGFNTAPDLGNINLNAATHGASYRQPSSSSTAAYVTFYSYPGSADIDNSSTFTANMLFKEHF